MGQKYASPDVEGRIVAFYDSVDSPVPKGVLGIEISDKQWLAFASVPHKYEDGKFLEMGYSLQLESPDQLVARLDSNVAAIYADWARFDAEYALREKAAEAYKAAGYTGDCSVWISAYATAVNVPLTVACDQILAQSEALRNARERVGALRMRKHEILALSGQEAEDRFQEIYAEIQKAVALIAD